MEILYLSHCVPHPPDKGDRIRACHTVACLAARHSLHVACFARSRAEADGALHWLPRCRSMHVEPLRLRRAAGAAALRFAAGESLSRAFYDSGRLRAYVRSLAARVRLEAVVAYSSPMGMYAPPQTPLFLDMADVDSEKWIEYGRLRRPGFFYRLEGGRLRRWEIELARRAERVFLTTQPELELLRRIAPDARAERMENGVDWRYFDPAAVAPDPSLAGRRVVVFVGAMDYYPNADAACRFAGDVLPELRRLDPDVEFVVVGRNPAPAVRRLEAPGRVRVTGEVADVRPFLAGAWAVVAPLRVARGIQNKVLEALAMGKPVLASPAVCRTFGPELPAGVRSCATPSGYAEALADAGSDQAPRAAIREAARRRFSWDANLSVLLAAIEGA